MRRLLQLGTALLATATVLGFSSTSAGAVTNTNETRDFTFTQAGNQYTCTVRGLTTTFFQDGITTIAYTTRLDDPEQACVDRIYLAGALVTYLRSGDEEPETSSAQAHNLEVNGTLRVNGPVTEVSVEHSATFICDNIRPPLCTFSWTVHPK